MRKIGIVVTRLDLRSAPAFRSGRARTPSLNGSYWDRVDVHHEKRRGDQFGGHEALVEQPRCAAYLKPDIPESPRSSDGCTAATCFQHLGSEGPVLHLLRGQLHEIASTSVRPRYSRRWNGNGAHARTRGTAFRPLVDVSSAGVFDDGTDYGTDDQHHRRHALPSARSHAVARTTHLTLSSRGK